MASILEEVFNYSTVSPSSLLATKVATANIFAEFMTIDHAPPHT